MFASIDGFNTFGKFLNAITNDDAVFVTNIINMEMLLPYIRDEAVSHTRYNVYPPESEGLNNPFNNIKHVSLIYKSNEDGSNSLEYNNEPVLTSKTLME